MVENKLVSVCIPTFNNARYIGKTLKSIVNQTHKNIEIIICDNASTDNTHEIVESFNDTRIKYYRNPETIACLANWNVCVKLSKADYVAIYHSDDIYEPVIVEQGVEFLLKNSEVGAVFCLDKTINENDMFISNGVSCPREVRSKKTIDFHALFRALLKEWGSFLVAPTFMAKKEVFQTVGWFEETEKFGTPSGSAGDTEMWLRIARKYKVGVIQERLIKRRISGSQGSSRYEFMRTSRANHFFVLDAFLNSAELTGKMDKAALAQYEFNKLRDDTFIARNLVELGRQKEAKEVLLRAISEKNVATAFKGVKNFIKLCEYAVLLLGVQLGVAQKLVKFLRWLKCKKWLPGMA